MLRAALCRVRPRATVPASRTFRTRAGPNGARTSNRGVKIAVASAAVAGIAASYPFPGSVKQQVSQNPLFPDALLDLQFHGNAKSCSPKDNSGISRIDVGIVASRAPHLVLRTRKIPLPTHSMYMFNLLDGAPAVLLDPELSQAAIAYMADILSRYSQTPGDVDPKHIRPLPPSHKIEDTLKLVFLVVDDSLLRGSLRKRWLDVLAEATDDEDVKMMLEDYDRDRCTAIMGVYETDSRTLRVALTGDSRALLGRPVPNSSPPKPPSSHPVKPTGNNLPIPAKHSEYSTLYCPITLTADQTPSNPEEVSRREALHPKESLVIDDPNTLPKQMLSLGSPTTRAFGADLSTSTALQEDHRIRELMHSFTADPAATDRQAPNAAPPGPSKQWPPPPPSNPPTVSGPSISITAEPEILSIQIKPGDFLVIGSKGLYECLDDEEIIGLVGIWIEERKQLAREQPLLGNPVRGNAYNRHEDQPNEFDDVDPLFSTDPRVEEVKQLVLQFSAKVGQGSVGEEVQSLVEKIIKTAGRDQEGRRRRLDRGELPIVSTRSLDIRDEKLARLDEKNRNLNSERKAFRYSISWNAPGTPFVYDARDQDSVSAHILRNALGGSNKKLSEALLVDATRRRKRFSDDIALEVIFFE